MKRFLILTLILIAISSLLIAEKIEYTPQRHSISVPAISTMNGKRAELDMNRGSTRHNREEVIHYIQDWEEGWADWTTFDRTYPSAMWHLSEWNAHGGDGYSWWMADPEIGGYRNGQYTFLDTPQIMVSAGNSTLTFNLNYRVEELGNWQDPNNPNEFYNGWDGANVRISTNNGESWTVISGTPAYNSSSMFAFGRIHGEGPNVPGWGGNSNGWVNASFNLQQYIGQNVKIRFAFAADNAVDSASNPELHSVMVDNISLGDYNQNFNDGEVHGMTFGSKVPTGGDLWHIGEPLPLPPSPTHAVICQNEDGTYNRNMFNYLYSPPIELPSGGDIRVDFMITGGIFYEEGTFPNASYWGFEITPDDGNTWYAMSNPYGDPGGSNYVYVGAPENWTSAVAGYNGLDGVISDYAGETVQFRWYLRTIDEPPVGRGLLIDDFTVYHTEYLPAPTNLVATDENRVVHLSWSAPGMGGEEGWIHWDDGENDNGIGLSNPEGGTFDVAAKFTPLDLTPYWGGYISRIKFFPRDVAASTFTVKIWTGLSGNVTARQQNVPAQTITPNQWNEVQLTEPLQIAMGEHYWVGYTVSHGPGAFPAGIDAGPVVPDKGDMIKLGPSWASLNVLNPDFNGNWNIQALVEIPVNQRNTVTEVLNNHRQGPDAYKIYRSTVSGDYYQHIGTVEDPEITIYTDMDPIAGMINYYVVTAAYGNSESAPTNEVMAFVLSDTATEVAYDDGVAESGYSVGNNNHLAVYFTPDIPEMVYLTHIKFYIETKRTGSMIVKVWVDNGGVPGTLVAQFILASTAIQEGWNVVPIPPANPVSFTGQDFFIGYQEAVNASLIGVDEDNLGNSYKKTGNDPWEEFTTGNLMIRAILNTQLVGIEKEDLIPSVAQLTVRNYPNPFNPDTRIEFNLPQDSEVNLSIYNLKGQLINTLTNEKLSQGSHSFIWDGRDSSGRETASGIYFYRVVTDTQSVSGRMVLLK